MIGQFIRREEHAIGWRATAAAIVAVLLPACSQPRQLFVLEDRLPTTDALYRAHPVTAGRFVYAPDRDTFAPVLTEPFAYPTQRQADHAWRRANFSHIAVIGAETRLPAIRLFGCKPGALDSLTGRITRFRGPVVHCAVDIVLPPAQSLRRETVNFYHHGGVWNLLPTDPPRAPVAWLNREKSERDPWRFLPWRERYE